MVEDIPGHHQFLGAGAADELVEAAPHRVRAADHGGAERVAKDRARIRIEPRFEILDRRGYPARPAHPVVQRGLLQ